MKLIDILAITRSRPVQEHVIMFAERLGRQRKGLVSALVVGEAPGVPIGVAGWLDPTWEGAQRQAEDETEKDAAQLTLRLGRETWASMVESEVLAAGAIRHVVGGYARHYDAAIVARPDGDDRDVGHAMLEGPLFQSGRPVFVVPPNWSASPIGKTVLVCWKSSREAARALADASDLIDHADTVCIATVNARTEEKGGVDETGADIIAHLRRRGVETSSVALRAHGDVSEAQALLYHAIAIGADLVVMGGYGHSRAGEFVFGGVTHEMVRTSTVPMLMSH